MNEQELKEIEDKWREAEDAPYHQRCLCCNATGGIPGLLEEVKRLKNICQFSATMGANDKLAFALWNMPPNSSLSYHPMSDDPINFQWHFNRPGESTFAAANPLLALTMHTMPISSEPLPPQTSKEP